MVFRAAFLTRRASSWTASAFFRRTCFYALEAVLESDSKGSSRANLSIGQLHPLPVDNIAGKIRGVHK